MANDTKAPEAKAARVKRTSKTEWSPKLADVAAKTPTVLTRTVKSKTPGDDPQDIQYTERKLVNVSDPAEAVKLLKLKPKQAVRALVMGANKISRADAVDDIDLAQRIADRKGISVQEAREKYL
jgi:hypothetical protein